jgi:hypothetical protein
LPRRIVVLAVIWFQVMASTYSPYQRSSVRRKPKTATGAVDLLRANDTMAALLPTVTRMIALQRDCAAVLPSMFASCDVLQFDAGQLLLSIPNAALAAKLKQQLPKLQAELLKSGWQVNSIRLKVQVTKSLSKSTISRQLTLPSQAVSALAELGATLEKSPRNANLNAAIAALLARRRQPG